MRYLVQMQELGVLMCKPVFTSQYLYFTLSFQAAQNLPFQQILSTLDFFTYWTAS